jgi:hypothetical protein
MEVTKLKDFVEEMQTYHDFTKLELAKAKRSKVTTKNDPYFRQVVTNYCNGLYDGDIDMLIGRIVDFLKEEPS